MRYRVIAVQDIAVVVGLLSASVSHVRAENRPINTERSTLTVLVFKSGLFSAFADNHVISAPIAAGSISEDSPLSIDVTVRGAGSPRAQSRPLGRATGRATNADARTGGARCRDVPRYSVCVDNHRAGRDGSMAGDRPLDHPRAGANHYVPGRTCKRNIPRRSRHQAARLRDRANQGGRRNRQGQRRAQVQFEIVR